MSENNEPTGPASLDESERKLHECWLRERYRDRIMTEIAKTIGNLDREGPASPDEYAALCERFGESMRRTETPQGVIAEWQGEHARDLWRRSRNELTYSEICEMFKESEIRPISGGERDLHERWLRERFARERDRERLMSALSLDIPDGASIDRFDDMVDREHDWREWARSLAESVGSEPTREAISRRVAELIEDRNRVRDAHPASLREVVARLPERLGRPETLPDLLAALDRWRSEEAGVKSGGSPARAAGFDAGVRKAIEKVASYLPKKFGRPETVSGLWDALDRWSAEVKTGRSRDRAEGFNEGVEQVLRTLRGACEIEGEMTLAEMALHVEGLARDSRILRTIADVCRPFDSSEEIPAKDLPDCVARMRSCMEELETIAERLDVGDLDASNRVAELLDEIDEARVKVRAAIELLGATRSILGEVSI